MSKSLTCPFDDFFNKNKKPPGSGRGSGGAGGDRKKQKEGDHTKEPQPTTNPTIPQMCVAAVNKLKSAHPSWGIPRFAIECGVPVNCFTVGTKGGCSNYQLLGKCENKACKFKHIPCTVADAKQQEVSGLILDGLKVTKDKKKTNVP